MKKTLVAALLLTLIWAPNAVANGTGCHSIKDWDARHQCLAEARSNYSYCYSVRGHDGRK